MDRKTKPDRKENFEEKDKYNSDLSEKEECNLSMKIDFLGHSGFFVETESVLLLFDYYYGDLSFLAEKPEEKPLFIFASHAHEDHFNPEIFSLADIHPKTKYLLSFDIKGNPAVAEDRDIQYLDADMTYEIEGLGTVKTLFSNDEGIAFLLKTACETLFHAGDLNCWDWPGEDPEWLQWQETAFKREIQKLAGTPIDVALRFWTAGWRKITGKAWRLFCLLCVRGMCCRCTSVRTKALWTGLKSFPSRGNRKRFCLILQKKPIGKYERIKSDPSEYKKQAIRKLKTEKGKQYLIKETLGKVIERKVKGVGLPPLLKCSTVLMVYVHNRGVFENGKKQLK